MKLQNAVLIASPNLLRTGLKVENNLFPDFRGGV